MLNGTALNTRSILIQVYNTTFVTADFAHGTALAFLLAALTAAARRRLRAAASEGDRMNGTARRPGAEDRSPSSAIVVWSVGPIVLGVLTSISTQRDVDGGAVALASAHVDDDGLPRAAPGLVDPARGRHRHRGGHVQPLDVEQRPSWR